MSASIWLGMETSLRPGSVAAVAGDRDAVLIELPGEVSTSESLLPTLERLIGGMGIRGDSLAGIGVCLGPGSYTGLRIGAATAMGLVSGWRVPLKGVPALRAIAFAAVSEAPVLSVIRAREGEVFAAADASSDPFSTELLPPGVYECRAVADWLARNGAVCAGPGAEMVAGVSDPSLTTSPGADTIARLASILHGRSGPDPFLRPLYLRSFRQKARQGVS
ncbi:MAG: tRNA (adenosine(37)-N6)-threonylcarbamoyltransferase complex dimerization subunit type 1 TsaB [Candidatus Fermentibacter sp.]|nr:tRNA (adenosine(37)-N6)-threonylcarbamoyltransferase complex dimerization subunit type 1 TsaB [Candidatus Fermentibacter sp.]